MMRNYSPVISLLLIGCATKTVLLPVNYQFIDVPEEHRIELIYRNESPHTMCLAPEMWPNSAGAIHEASDNVFLIVGGQRLPIEATNTGYCYGGCALRIAPAEKISASIPYSAFNLPERLTGKPKRLDFSPVAFKCRKK